MNNDLIRKLFRCGNVASKFRGICEANKINIYDCSFAKRDVDETWTIESLREDCILRNKPRKYLLFEFDRNSISLFEEYRVAPEIIPKTCELMVLPLAEGPSGQLEFSLGPVALCVKQGVDWNASHYQAKQSEKPSIPWILVPSLKGATGFSPRSDDAPIHDRQMWL